jgi:Ca2+-transporting ATPase
MATKDPETGKAAEESVQNDPPWHVMSKEDVFKELGLPDDIRKRGLTTEEATTRLAKYGPNQLTEKRKETLLEKIWKQIANVLVGILLFVAVVSGIRIATGADAVTNGIQIAIIIGVIV